MSATPSRPDVDAELAMLKDFQRRTVDRVHEQFWHPTDPTRRFLVADEVGLGKTLVARGVIAKTIDHLWETVDRIDVVYICSNTQIAHQNLPKLRVGEGIAERHHADRLTMLASELRHLEGRKLNFVSFTPGTSFSVGGSGGRVEERVLLYHLLKATWSNEVRPGPWLRFFRGRVDEARFRRRIDDFNRSHLSADLVRDFAESVQTLRNTAGQTLIEELREGVEAYKGLGGRKAPEGVSARRYRIIGRLRRALARAAVKRLEPDLVILDEFQRFKDLMSDDGEGADLARELFDHGDARLLLLSATPFKMYTLPEEPEGDDHYRDFVDTVRFLAGDDRASRVKTDLAALRASLYAGDREGASAARDRAQAELRRIMSRTERLATSAHRDGMVVERTLPSVRLEPDDVRDYRRLHRVSRVLESQDPLEFWRAAPYVLELMESYQVKQKLQRHDAHDPALVAALSGGGARLRWDDVRDYLAVDPGNAKMRGLVGDTVDSGAWQLVWIPPSLPYYELGGAYAAKELREFTKRLVFSAWAVAPKAIGSIVSYEAERRIAAKAAAASSAAGFTRYDATRPPGLLSFNRAADGRLGGMPVVGLLYPSVALAEAGDPLSVAAEMGEALPLDRDAFQRLVRTRVEALLAGIPEGEPSSAPDERWYWAAGILLDRLRDVHVVDDLSYGFHYEESDDPSRFSAHVEEAALVEAEDLGRRPDDLSEVLTRLAIGGFGVCAARALGRSGSSEDLSDQSLQDAASNMAWSLRNHFNKPEVMGLVVSQERRPYWQDALSYCVDGCLQSVLDEYVYLLEQAVADGERSETWFKISERFDEAASLRTSTHTFHDIRADDGAVSMESHRTRTHFAVRFGRGVAEDDKNVMREGQVRAAFNSPFWPFVLASTSVGQEGLDFHYYSHAIVHWNLPANPVDLEQREGRVHRYQGHAVRRNVAAGYSSRPEVAASGDPWPTMFELAAADRPEGSNDLYPSWTPPLAGSARIERYVPSLPLSRETHSLRRLLRTVGAYRLVLGQPRQSDLLRYLGDRAADLGDLSIDLEP
ncbi:helicase-related protein [Nocardioides silvaticus]|uniref:helicase-related protein n=1 Tax=Nocardioides silvaticus TaxID=2201891 RepID=UPI0011B1E6B8|nr:helicase-related protein [Nocardioides silvaticus]